MLTYTRIVDRRRYYDIYVYTQTIKYLQSRERTLTQSKNETTELKDSGFML